MADRSIQRALIDLTGSAGDEFEVVPAVAEHSIRVLAYHMVADDGCGVLFTTGSGTEITPEMSMGPSAPHSTPYSEKTGWFQTVSGTELGMKIESGGPVQVSGILNYRLVRTERL